ncbi:MAG TPA: hypothetical protein VM940_08160 [Chthoniobacterales bacterium]|nr:hypothetical protein [Chthoniobacterales bacterium]
MKNVSKKPVHAEGGAMSAEALIGLGITVGSLGLLCLMLGWAQHMRSVQQSAVLWLSAGAILVVVGVVLTVVSRSRRERQ